jgi:hypothetical protein
MNFHGALVAVEGQLFKATQAVALWNSLHLKVKTCQQLKGKRETSFLDAAMASAWTAAIVNCYALQDTRKNTSSFEEVVSLSAESDPDTGEPFLQESLREEIIQRLKSARKIGSNIEILRHNREGHISLILIEPDFWDSEKKARNDLQRYLGELTQILNAVEVAAGYQKSELSNIEKEIADDLDVLFTAYPKLKGFPHSRVERLT